MKAAIPLTLLVLAALALPGGATDSEASEYPLHQALEREAYDEALRLIPLIRDLDAPDADGRTPLTIAASDFTADAYDMVQALLLAGADPDVADASGNAPLHHAAEAGTLSVVQLLADRFAAELDVVNNDGERSVDLAWIHQNNRVVSFLASRGLRLSAEQEEQGRIEAEIENRYKELMADIPEGAAIAGSRESTITIMDMQLRAIQETPGVAPEMLAGTEAFIKSLKSQFESTDYVPDEKEVLEQVGVASREAVAAMTSVRLGLDSAEDE